MSASSGAAPAADSGVPDLAISQQHIYFPLTVPAGNAKIENIILITNRSAQPALWKMRRSQKSPCLVHPTSGMLHPREERRVTVSCTGPELAQIVTGGSSERLQVIARFLHPTDNQSAIAESWNNAAADGMSKLKVDLPVVLTDTPPAMMHRHQRSVSRDVGTAAGSSATAAGGVRSSTPNPHQRAGTPNQHHHRAPTPTRESHRLGSSIGGLSQNSAGNNNTLTLASLNSTAGSVNVGSATAGGGGGGVVGQSPGAASTTAVSQSPARSMPFETSPSPRLSQAQLQQQQQQLQQQQQQQRPPVAPQPQPPAQTTALTTEDSAGLLLTSAQSSMPSFRSGHYSPTGHAKSASVHSNGHSQQQQQQPKQSGAASSSAASVHPVVTHAASIPALGGGSGSGAAKESLIKRLALLSIPIYLFFPLLVLAFAIGLRYGGVVPPANLRLQ